MQKPCAYVEVPTKAVSQEWKLYKRRWFMVLLFSSFALVSALQWVEYTSITNAVSRYYNVSPEAVSWTTLIFMFIYIIDCVPIFYIASKMSIRASLITASFGVFVGACVKLFSVSSDRFYVVMIGQTIESIFQTFTYGVATRVSSSWFGASEVALANTLCLLGDQLGTALSFFIPSSLVNGNSSILDIEQGLHNLNLFIAVISTISLISILWGFENEPPKPPSLAKKIQKELKMDNFWTSLKSAMTLPFILVLISYGIGAGCSNTFGIMLEILVNKYKEEGEDMKSIGLIGFIYVMMGIFGSIGGALFLDKTHLFKETALASLTGGLVTFTFLGYYLGINSMIGIYVCATIQGLFLAGFYVFGVQLAIEVTYPIPEEIPSFLMLLSVQTCTIIMTHTSTWCLEYYDDFRANIPMYTGFLISIICKFLLSGKMKRQEVEHSTAVKSELQTFVSSSP